MDSSMELTKEAEEYRLARPGTVSSASSQAHASRSRGGGSSGGDSAGSSAAAGSASASHLQRLRGKAEEDAMTCQLFVPSRTSLFVGCNSGNLIVWKPKNEFQSGTHTHIYCTHRLAIAG